MNDAASWQLTLLYRRPSQRAQDKIDENLDKVSQTVEGKKEEADMKLEEMEEGIMTLVQDNADTIMLKNEGGEEGEEGEEGKEEGNEEEGDEEGAGAGDDEEVEEEEEDINGEEAEDTEDEESEVSTKQGSTPLIFSV